MAVTQRDGCLRLTVTRAAVIAKFIDFDRDLKNSAENLADRPH